MCNINHVSYFQDMFGRFYIIHDVEALLDCTTLSILGNPNFKAPFCSAEELHCTVVSFAREATADESGKIYALLKGGK